MQSASLFSDSTGVLWKIRERKDLQPQAMFVRGSSDSLKFCRSILSPLVPNPDEKASLEEAARAAIPASHERN